MHKFITKSLFLANLIYYKFVYGVVLPPPPPSIIPPASPFGDMNDICPLKNGVEYSVDGFTGTPYIIEPFKDTFKNTPVLKPLNKVCRKDGHCIVSYNIDIYDTQVRIFDKSIKSCVKLPGTWGLSYGGMIPGPTIIVPTGHESLVRFNNKISTKYFKQSYAPCINGRKGRPISVHLHGSASLAPYDGWAEDETCVGETKDYVYPNNRPVTGWYHDHALHITADNAYLGLAGLYITSSKKKHGGCGEPWNLENIEEFSMVLSDKTLNKQCQFRLDIFNDHEKDFYGDINLVSGIPFPNMPVKPKWYRFRFLNAAVSRPYLIKLKNQQLQDIGHDICKIIAADGGYRNEPVDFPQEGLLMGVAERFEVVCDFTDLKGQTLYFWNDRDEKTMKGVPYFCYSHLIAKVSIESKSVINPPIFKPRNKNPVPVTPLNKVFTPQDIQRANLMASIGLYHREFVFGRTNGHWTINGETWDTMKIAASDVGLHTWELWKFKTGGGWFHPIHIHLVDFFILRRDGEYGVRLFEKDSPKDVFYLGPSNEVWVIARFGPHKGDYMFHCHNLIHEDNDMMRAMHMVDGGQGLNAETSEKFIANPLHKIIYNNWRYADPMLGETSAIPTTKTKKLSLKYANTTLNKNLYRIFYPLQEDRQLMMDYENPWESQHCKF